MHLVNLFVATLLTSLVLSQANSVSERIQQVRKIAERMSINCLSCALSALPYKNSQPICPNYVVKEPTLDVLITPESGADYFYLSQSFKEYICKLECYLIQQERLRAITFPGRKLQYMGDPSIIIVSLNLVYIAPFFYQSIVYYKNSLYYYQMINTGMMMSGRRLQSSPPSSNTRPQTPTSFSSRETEFRQVMALLRIKPILRGMVTRNFSKLKTFIPELKDTFEASATKITIQNAGDVFSVCGRSLCVPS
jgi:hypothetical protein